jgi:hypothetical protein
LIFLADCFGLTRMKILQKYCFYGVALVVLLGVFALYTRPDFLVTLANQIWACF